MLDIQFKKEYVAGFSGRKHRRNYVSVNGITDEIGTYMKNGKIYSVYVRNPQIVGIILNSSFSDLPNYIDTLNITKNYNLWGEMGAVEIVLQDFHEERKPFIRIELTPEDLEHWNKPWSITSLAKELKKAIESVNTTGKYYQLDPDSVLGGFGIEYLIDDFNALIGKYLDDYSIELKELGEKTLNGLISMVESSMVLTQFQFPADIKIACHQYLIYFAQFLEDMGIAVETELKEDLNKSLFKVIPKNKNESLEKIREVLSIYLNAPAAPNFESEAISHNDISAKQWEANVYHLKSQLLLAKSVIQMKDATIDALQLTNYQYQKALKETDNSDSVEPVLGGVVSIKNYDGGWFNLNLPKIFRSMKRIFK